MRGIWAAAERSKINQVDVSKASADSGRFSRIALKAGKPDARVKFLPGPQAARLLGEYQIPYPEHFFAANAWAFPWSLRLSQRKLSIRAN
jgi:hypothetical protein